MNNFQQTNAHVAANTSSSQPRQTRNNLGMRFTVLHRLPNGGSVISASSERHQSHRHSRMIQRLSIAVPLL
jgi:hypothetical protein